MVQTGEGGRAIKAEEVVLFSNNSWGCCFALFGSDNYFWKIGVQSEIGF